MVAFPAYQRFAESTAASPLPFCVEHLGDLKLFLAVGIPDRAAGCRLLFGLGVGLLVLSGVDRRESGDVSAMACRVRLRVIRLLW